MLMLDVKAAVGGTAAGYAGIAAAATVGVTAVAYAYSGGADTASCSMAAAHEVNERAVKEPASNGVEFLVSQINQWVSDVYVLSHDVSPAGSPHDRGSRYVVDRSIAVVPSVASS